MNMHKNNISLRSLKPYLLPILAAAGFIVACATGMYSAMNLKKARQMPNAASMGSSALDGVRTSWSDEEARIRAERQAQEEAARILAERRAKEEERINNERQTANNNYRAAVVAEYEEFKNRVSERAAAFDNVRLAVPGIVGQYNFKKCWTAMCALVKDKIAQTTGRGSQDNLKNYINGDLCTSFYQPMQDARGEVLQLLIEFKGCLEARRTEWKMALDAIPGWDTSLGEIPESLMAESLRIETMIQTIAAAQIGAVVSAAFDAVCLPKVCFTVCRLLAGAAARFAAGSTASAVIAMADSPAPGPADLVGLAFFGVSAATTAWEIHKVAKVIPAELAAVMYRTVDEQCAEVLKNTMDEGEKLFLAYVQGV